jgi:excinuclease ABC subunit C
MKEAAEALAFEQAARLRDQVSALERTLEKQLVASQSSGDQDVFGFTRQDASVAISLLFIRDGLISGSRSFFLEDPYDDDTIILSQVLNQFYDHDSYIPREILTPFLPEDEDLTTERLVDLRQGTVVLSAPQRGDKRKLVEMATANSDQVFADREKKEQSWQSLANSLQKKLRLQRVPETIECLDISNTSGKLSVGSLVCFEKGEPNKSRFRHYRIKSIDTPDDYAMMREVLTRRLSRGIEEDNLPDMFVVDGGKGQLGMALSVAEELGIIDQLDWIGIAKERQEEGEKLYKPYRKNPILLPQHNPVLLYLMRIRDESHRYGVTFHRKLRNKSSFHSELDKIDGVGGARKKILLKEFGSLKRIKEAELAELIEVKGIGRELANTIYNYFRNE